MTKNNVWEIFSTIIERRKRESPAIKEKHMHACAAVHKNSILAYGRNFHIVGEDKTMHSEVDCILQHNKIGRKKIDLYVARTTWNNSRPCINCIKSILKTVETTNLKVGYVYYTLDEGHYAKYRLYELANDLSQHISSYNRHLKGIDDSSSDEENMVGDKFKFSF